ncbi:MAG: hypothetical protein KatS3mg061_1285 [Dehalococcoidia bacterium]|nr:MAG: hypothetical protein KatS3mg061_1285 [Dehalococcoidia bacterium]
MTRLLARTYPAGVLVGLLLALLVAAGLGLPALDFGRLGSILGYRDGAKYLSMVVHFLTAIVWLGGITVQFLVLVAPGLSESQRERLYALLVPWMWGSLLLLIPTGVYNTLNNPVTEFATSYEQLLQLRARPYGQVLVVKHIFVVLSLGLAGVAHFVVLPRWQLLLDEQRPTGSVVTTQRVVSGVAVVAAAGLLWSVTRLVLFGH